MSRAVIADTGPLYAAVDSDDEHHEQAHWQLNRLSRAGRPVLIAYPTLFEAYTLILYRLGKPSASRWLVEVGQGAILLNPEPGDYQRAIARLQNFPDQEITLFDSLVAELVLRLRADVWTFDHHFDLMRVSVWRASE